MSSVQLRFRLFMSICMCISALLILNLLYLNFPHIDRICEILSLGIIELLCMFAF